MLNTIKVSPISCNIQASTLSSATANCKGFAPKCWCLRLDQATDQARNRMSGPKVHTFGWLHPVSAQVWGLILVMSAESCLSNKLNCISFAAQPFNTFGHQFLRGYHERKWNINWNTIQSLVKASLSPFIKFLSATLEENNTWMYRKVYPAPVVLWSHIHLHIIGKWQTTDVEIRDWRSIQLSSKKSRISLFLCWPPVFYISAQGLFYHEQGLSLQAADVHDDHKIQEEQQEDHCDCRPLPSPIFSVRPVRLKHNILSLSNLIPLEQTR